LLSAVTSAFIIQVNSQLQPDSGDQTTALLRVLIYKIDNTTFGNVPTPPLWGGPSWTTVLAQILLVISLASSLFSAFLAVLGKEWLGHYESTDPRETVIERGQNRQQKLESIIAWHFHHAMQLLPLMLQAALFFLGFAVPLSLVDINTAIAFVALGLTSFGVLFHISLVVVGAAFKSCPYQTSASYLLRHLRPQFPSIVHSLKVNNQLHLTRVFSGLDENTHLVDLQCVSWILWTSLDKTVHLSTLRHLLSIPTLDGIEPTLALTCFYIFTSCAGLRNNRVVIVQGWEQLAMASARCLFRTLEHHFSSTDPRTPSVLEDLRRRYNRVFPFNADFRGLPYYFTMVRIHAWAHRHREPRDVRWDNYTPPAQEHIPFARHMVEVAQEEYQGRKVPCWILRFAMHSLSQDPPSPASVIADCLKIVAIDLDLDASKITVLNERWA
jgi:hypothetical protein